MTAPNPTYKHLPAFPTWELNGQGKPEMTCFGLTAIEYAAIKLRVPNSGTDWLDDMIRTSQRNEIAAKAMQGLMGRSWANSATGKLPENLHAVWATAAHQMADAMMKASEA